MTDVAQPLNLIPDPNDEFVWQNFRRLQDWSKTQGGASTSTTSTVRTQVTGTRSFSLINPTVGVQVTIFRAPVASTISKVTAVVVGTGPSATWTMYHGSDRSGTGTEVIAGGATTTNTTTGQVFTAFNSDSLAADEWLWVVVSGTGGTITELHITIEFDAGFEGKSVTLITPATSMKPTIFKADAAYNVTKLVGVIRGATSVTYTVRKASSRAAAGTEVVTGGNTVTSTTTGDVVSSFSSAGIAYGDWLWLDVTAVSGSPSEFHLTINMQRV